MLISPPISMHTGLHRGELFAVLHAEAVAAGVRVVLDCRVMRFVNRECHVEVFIDRDESLGVFDFLLAADGSRSQLRRASSGLPAYVYNYPHGTLGDGELLGHRKQAASVYPWHQATLRASPNGRQPMLAILVLAEG